MCVAFLALSVHSDYPFILALNRDEFFERPTIPVHIRREDPRIIAGKDLEGNGTWLGITTEGRFGIVTNVRDLGQSRNGTFSRGQLVEAFLKSDVTASDYIQSVRGASDKYNPFNMLVGTLQEVIYFTNRTGVTQVLSAGLHGLSNGLLNEAWPKVLRGKTLIKPILETSSLPSKKLLELLKDKWQPGDGELPDTGVGLEFERALAPIFVRIPEIKYGTRSSSVILFNRTGEAMFSEVTYSWEGEEEKREFRFRVNARLPVSS